MLSGVGPGRTGPGRVELFTSRLRIDSSAQPQNRSTGYSYLSLTYFLYVVLGRLYIVNVQERQENENSLFYYEFFVLLC